MYASFSVTSSDSTYEVTVAAGLTGETLRRLCAGQILADEYLRTLIEPLSSSAIFLPAHESEKSLERTPILIERMRAAGMNRRSQLVAVGGGIIQDIAAFAASIYMRGMDWVYLPTTVLAMVDSCIGGKSSINVGPYKNLVGTFHPPRQIFIDPELARTLPSEQFVGGLVEAAKISFCRGPETFAAYLAENPSAVMPAEALEKVILTSLHAKRYFIEIDEFDQKERLLLNFGHTFGHAMEGASHFAIPHGIAVGLGILASLAFQRSQGIDLSGRAEVAQLEAHLESLICKLPGLREKLRALQLHELLERFRSDKKHSSSEFHLILVAPSGEVRLECLDRNAAVEEAIQAAFQATIERYA